MKSAKHKVLGLGQQSVAGADTPALGDLQAWIGRQDRVEDAMPCFPANALAATLDRNERFAPGDALPALWHWIYFLDLHRTNELAGNGHVRHGGFLPPMPYPRRMFAGGRIRFHRPLPLGAVARRTSTIASIESKIGRSGPLAFMRMRNVIEADGVLALEEEQDIVYREPGSGASSAAPVRGGEEPAWEREVSANEMMLFRYSALIFNAHRIHWDRPYAVGEEGYPGLVVHGQLIATWLADLVKRHSDRAIAAFEFRSLRALFDGEACRLCGSPAGDAVRLWAQNDTGAVVMQARAELA